MTKWDDPRRRGLISDMLGIITIHKKESLLTNQYNGMTGFSQVMQRVQEETCVALERGNKNGTSMSSCPQFPSFESDLKQHLFVSQYLGFLLSLPQKVMDSIDGHSFSQPFSNGFMSLTSHIDLFNEFKCPVADIGLSENRVP